MLKRILQSITFVVALSVCAFAQTGPGNIQPPAVSTLQNAAAADGNGAAINTRLFGSVTVQVTGTFSGTVNFEATMDGSTWQAVQGTKQSDNSQASTATAAGAYFIALPGFESFRARISGYASGTITVKARPVPSVARASPGGAGGITVTEEDGSPSVRVQTQVFPNGALTDNGNGSVSIAFPSGVGGDVTHTAGDLTANRLVIGNSGADLKASNVVITNPASAATFTLTAGKTFIVSNTLTLAGTDSSTLNIGAGGTLGSNAFTSTAFVPATLTVNGKALSSNITLGLASSDFANQGTATTILHGNAAGNPSFGQIINADVSNSAAIAYSKLNLTGAILNADLAGSIAYSKLSLTGAILNADLAGSIAISKLAITGTPDGTKFLRDDGSWQAASGVGGGASTALDNLASVAINTSLLSDTDNTDDLGSSSKRWKDLYLSGAIKNAAGSNITIGNVTLIQQGGGGANGAGYVQSPQFFGSSSLGVYEFKITANSGSDGSHTPIALLGSDMPLVWNSGTNLGGSFTGDTGIIRNAAGVVEANNGTPGTLRDFLARAWRSNAVTFANVPASPVEGMIVAITDSSTATWGATITGGGANHVLGYYNGTNWTVAAK